MNLRSHPVVHVQDVQNLSASLSSVAANSRFPRKIAAKCGSGTFYVRERSQSPLIPLDFWSALTDTSGNTLVAPLLELILNHSSDVYQGRVLTKQNALSELQRITAAPPLLVHDWQAHLGQLLFCACTIDQMSATGGPV